MSMLKPYEKVLKDWDAKTTGAKPTIKQLKDIKGAGLARTGSKTAFALAMLMRDEGASQTQIKHALGATYRNRANQLCMLGLVRINRTKTNGQTRYKLEVRTVERLGVIAHEQEHAHM